MKISFYPTKNPSERSPCRSRSYIVIGGQQGQVFRINVFSCQSSEFPPRACGMRQTASSDESPPKQIAPQALRAAHRAKRSFSMALSQRDTPATIMILTCLER